MKCPNCSAENQTGKYCAECGASLDASCPECGADVPPGSRFCTTCGEPVGEDGAAAVGSGGGAGGGSSRVAWVIAAGAVIVVLLVLFLPRDTEPVRPAGGSGAPFSGMGGGAAPSGGAGGMGGLSSDMRTNADRLFNRIMIAAEQGNQAEIDQFMPMAIQAYGMVENLDMDGRYHLGVLELTAENYEAARQTAGAILNESPDHILALGIAAQAEAGLGNEDAADQLWQRLLDAYPEESGKPLTEYMDHQPMLEEYRGMAREAVD